MKREFLTDLKLDKEVTDKIMVEYGKSLNDTKAKLTESETKLTETQAKIKGLEESLTKRDADIESLKKSSEADTDLKTKLAEMQTKYESEKSELEKTLMQTKKDSAIDLALTTAKARNNKAVRALLDVDNLELDGSTLKGLDKQLETLQTDNPYLFETKDVKPPATPKIITGGNPNPPPSDDLDPFLKALGGKKT